MVQNSKDIQGFTEFFSVFPVTQSVTSLRGKEKHFTSFLLRILPRSHITITFIFHWTKLTQLDTLASEEKENTAFSHCCFEKTYSSVF